MEKKLFIFNPENDLALAFGGPNYTAPPFAARLKHDLQAIPLWYADGQPVLTDSAQFPHEWLDTISQVVTPSFMSAEQVASANDSRAAIQAIPWGWSAAMRQFLIRRLHFPEHRLPTPKQVEAMRQLSHRRTSIDIISQCSNFMPMPPIPEENFSLDDALRFAMQHHDCYFKSPWSNSGHGVFHVFNLEASDFKEWCTGIIRRQGSVLCETALHPVLEFGVEFLSHDGKVEVVGFSVFSNDFHQQLNTSIVASSERLHTIIKGQFPDIDDVLQALTASVLHDIIPNVYSGYFGIDMMLYSDSDGNTRLNPCVELNLRPTFGLVTSFIGNKYLHPDSTGQFHFEYHPKGYVPTAASPLQVKGNRFSAGRLYLAPPLPGAQFTAYIDITPGE